VNSVSAVVQASPGFKTFLDLPPLTGKYTMHERGLRRDPRLVADGDDLLNLIRYRSSARQRGDGTELSITRDDNRSHIVLLAHKQLCIVTSPVSTSTRH
jgi:hypothetical protein